MAEIAALSCKTEQEIEQARVRLLGKKGEVTALFDEFRTVAPELKREFGQKLNVLKNAAAAKIEELKEAAAESPAAGAASFDYTMPGDPVQLGSRHPVSIAREEIVSIFRKFGYDVAEGPEVEDDWHVFEALNFPPEHPAREMQDTFFISDSDNPVLLRTHTSSVQVRAMEKMPLPIRIVCPGRVHYYCHRRRADRVLARFFYRPHDYRPKSLGGREYGICQGIHLHHPVRCHPVGSGALLEAFLPTEPHSGSRRCQRLATLLA